MARANDNIQKIETLTRIIRLYKNLHDLLLEETSLIQEIYNVIVNNNSEEEITILINRSNGINLQFQNIRININNNPKLTK
ncbi:hypothetical protein ACGRT8_01520 [Candidatus Phytoplasma australasiaticum]